MKKTLRVLFLTLLTALFLVSFASAASGTCGENLTWTLENGVLTISGSGAMDNWSYEEAPWYDEFFTTLVVEEGVTYIGTYAFVDCWNLETAELPASLKTIGEGAFEGCDRLSLTLPEGVEEIGEYAFAWCSFDQVSIPASVKEIGTSAFVNSVWIGFAVAEDSPYYKNDEQGVLYTIDGKTLLAAPWSLMGEFTVPEGVEYIADQAFSDCTYITTMHLPASLRELGWLCFDYSVSDGYTVAEGNANFKAVEGILYSADGAILWAAPEHRSGEFILPEGVMRVENGAFADCADLQVVTLPEGLESLGMFAFYNCFNLTEITIPASVTWIDMNAFYGCDNLQTVHYSGTQEQWDAITVNEENDPLFAAEIICTGTGEGGGQNPGGAASGTCGENLTWAFADGVLTVSGSGAMEDWLADEQPWWEFADGIAKVVIEDGVTSVGSSAFYTYYNLETVILGKDVETIGAFAFADCEKLTGITLPESIRTVNMAAFQNCTSLKWVENTAFITSLGAQALRNTALSTVDLTGVEEIFFGTMDSCDQLDTVILSEKLKAVGLGAFSGCSALTAVTFHGTQAQWDAIAVDIDNDPLLSANITCTAGEPEEEEKPTVSGSVSNVVGGASVIIGGVETPVNADGSFAIPVEGTFDVVIKVPGALSVTVKNVTAESGNVTLPEIVPVKGDTNGDDMINIMDMAAFRQNFGKMGANVANAFTDTNGDGMVNIMDMGTFRQNFGKTAAKDCTVVFGA